MMTKRFLMRITYLGMLFGVFALTHTVMALDAPHDFKENIITNPAADPTECADCHTFHGSSYPALLENLCETCHFSGVRPRR